MDLVADPVEIESATRDADDDYLIALARANEANLIVTGDRDLLEWPEQNPPVVSPASFVGILAEHLSHETGPSL